jgi:hypothetical protein
MTGRGGPTNLAGHESIATHGHEIKKTIQRRTVGAWKYVGTNLVAGSVADGAVHDGVRHGRGTTTLSSALSSPRCTFTLLALLLDH